MLSLKACSTCCHLWEGRLCGHIDAHQYLQCLVLLNLFSSGCTKTKDQEYFCGASAVANDNFCWHDFQKAMLIQFPAYLHMFIYKLKSKAIEF